MDITKLDAKTLEFAIQIAWQYKVSCKDTKEGKVKEKSFEQVEDTLKHYLEKLK